ncbi:MAG: leucine-rich repeat protein [Clostridiales bacterium]|nr:leucine-rich repeat protein [Clostridiales bacterium]
MAEAKNTSKKPTAKKPTQKTADPAAEKLENTAPDTATTTEQATAKPAAKKPAAKKTTTSTATKKSTTGTTAKKSTAGTGTTAKKPATKKPTAKQPSKQDQNTDGAELQTEVAATAEEQVTTITQPVTVENAVEPTVDSDQSVVTDEQTPTEPIAAVEDSKAEESKAEEHVEQKEPTAKSEKPAKASGKKPLLSKNLIIILACVLALVIVGVILAVCLTSCKTDDDKNRKYTVTFLVGGDVMTTYTLSAGEKINEPKDVPTLDMQTFEGWYLVNPNNSSESQKFVFGTTVSQNITLVAKFYGDTSVKVTFDPNCGAFENDKTVELLVSTDDAITEPTDKPTRFGYTFDGWYTEAECYNKFSFGSTLIENSTLYAGWARDTENFVFISYYGNDELLRVDPVRKNDNVVLPDLFANNDDIVVGDWMVDNNPNKPYEAGKATADLDLYASYYTVGLEFTMTRTNATVTGYDGTATEVIVPSSYNGRTVTGIGSYAFCRSGELSAVTSIKLPSTIVTIGEGAFYDCQYLTSINLTYNVLSIGAYAFYRNTRLRTVGDVTGVEGDKLGDGAFNGCKELRAIEFGGLLTKIGDYTFNDCAALAEVKLPDALTEIGEYAFSGCTSLKSITLESFVESIGDNAFAGCSSLTEVNIVKTSDEVAMHGNPFANCLNVTVYVPSALIEAYQNNTNNSQFKDKLAAR